MNSEDIMPRFIRPADVYDMLGMCRNQVDQQVKLGNFPAPIRLFNGGRRKAWLEAEVRAWLAERMKNARTTDATDEGEE